MTPTALVELRRYTLHPGRRDELIELFARELVETQEAVGLQVLGWFRDDDAPDHFVWLRGFPSEDPDERARALGAFYGGPAWAAHADAANATMVDSDDVLLLRPAWPAPDRVREAITGLGGGAVTLTTCLLSRALEPAELEGLVAALRSGPREVALVLSGAEDVPNRFPRLPVREEEHAVVWLSRDGASVPEGIALPLLGTPVVSPLKGAPAA